MVNYVGIWRLIFPYLRLLSGFPVALLLLTVTTSTVAEPQAKVDMAPAYRLLQRLAEASRQLTYQGTFTYEYGGSLKTVRVVHLVKDGREYERLIHLNGPSREVIRQGNSIDCERAGDKLLRGLGGLPMKRVGLFSNYYDLYIKGDNRVAGRLATVVHVVPKDRYRYGYALSLDKETGLLLQSMLIGHGKKVLERFQFVDIQVEALIDESEVMPVDPQHHVAPLEHAPCLEGNDLLESSGDWDVNWLPPGFVLSGESYTAAKQRRTLVFTDGLAVFSVFIDADRQLEVPEVQAQRGATVAFLMNYDSDGIDYSIGVVGEIPPATARRVAQSVSADAVSG